MSIGRALQTAGKTAVKISKNKTVRKAAAVVVATVGSVVAEEARRRLKKKLRKLR